MIKAIAGGTRKDMEEFIQFCKENDLLKMMFTEAWKLFLQRKK